MTDTHDPSIQIWIKKIWIHKTTSTIFKHCLLDWPDLVIKAGHQSNSGVLIIDTSEGDSCEPYRPNL